MTVAAAAPAAVFGQGDAEPYARALQLGAGKLTLRPEGRHYHTEAVEFDVSGWCEDANGLERSLLASLRGPVLDVGCGPGRLLSAARSLGLQALGLDTSAEAVRRAVNRGEQALEQSVFAAVPHTGDWQSIILLDGNIGIGGSITALLRRCRQLITARGTLLVEVEADEYLDTAYPAVLEDEYGNRSEPFRWARTGGPGLAARADTGGWTVTHIQRLQGRVFYRLSPAPEPTRSRT
ncbi:class I SAM-dependent methyltransferase [Arthrobacter sp. H16F315]|uniref:class I SAM-dependent methyltransferase n=1 Tax=Arthrobacter sp. H16F315 TaxID=2955314 RepID=UPI002096B964|nr:class I SAM-dependent methyltransferase [Arthrobacter sp. H16F315]